jgi:spore coat protein U-like protein
VKHGPTALWLTPAAPVQTLQRVVYGHIPGNQNLVPGSYRTAAPIVVTIEY